MDNEDIYFNKDNKQPAENSRISEAYKKHVIEKLFTAMKKLSKDEFTKFVTIDECEGYFDVLIQMRWISEYPSEIENQFIIQKMKNK